MKILNLLHHAGEISNSLNYSTEKSFYFLDFDADGVEFVAPDHVPAFGEGNTPIYFSAWPGFNRHRWHCYTAPMCRNFSFDRQAGILTIPEPFLKDHITKIGFPVCVSIHSAFFRDGGGPVPYVVTVGHLRYADIETIKPIKTDENN